MTPIFPKLKIFHQIKASLADRVRTRVKNAGPQFDSFQMEHEIISQFCAPRTSLQNGVIERKY